MTLTLNVCPGAGGFLECEAREERWKAGEGCAGEQGQSRIALGPEDLRPDLSCVSYALEMNPEH